MKQMRSQSERAPVRPPSNTVYYRGFNRCFSRCEIIIYPHKNFTAVSCAEINNPGTSITNMAASIATQVCAEHNIDHDQLVWIESTNRHDATPIDRNLKWPQLLVSFRSTNGRKFSKPQWRLLSSDEVIDILRYGKRPDDYSHRKAVLDRLYTTVWFYFTDPDKIWYRFTRFCAVLWTPCGEKDGTLSIKRGTEGKPVVEAVLKDIEATTDHRFTEVGEVQIHPSQVKIEANTMNVNCFDPFRDSPSLRDDDGNFRIPEPRVMPINIVGEDAKEPVYPFVRAAYDNPLPQIRWEDSDAAAALRLAEWERQRFS